MSKTLPKNWKKVSSITPLLFVFVFFGTLLFVSALSGTTSGVSDDIQTSEVGGQQINTQRVQKALQQKCEKDTEKDRECRSCKTAYVKYYNTDCSVYGKEEEDLTCLEDCPACIQGEEVNRICNGCKLAQVKYKNSDCTVDEKMVNDDTCISQCPKETSPQIVSPTPAPQPISNTFSCNCSKTCTQMSSCEEAYFQLNVCGCSARDGDNDGIPCESLCG